MTHDFLKRQIPTSRAAATIQSIARKCSESYPASNAAVELPADLSRLKPPSSAQLRDDLGALFLYAHLLSQRGERDEDPRPLRLAHLYLVRAFVKISRANRFPLGQRNAALKIAARLADGIRMPSNVRRELSARLEEFARLNVKPELSTVLPLTGEDLEEVRQVIRAGIVEAQTPDIAIPPIGEVPPLPSAPDLISEKVSHAGAAPDQHWSPLDVRYDDTDAFVRVASVEFSGFRGSPASTVVDFTSSGRAVSTLVFGENGVGKSTIVDAIEFGLQGRVGRSLDFDSPLAPAIRSFASHADRPVVAVRLSDGSVVSRTTTESGGVTRPAPTDIRPGFRLAPVTLKRADIQRFLDTEALERGTVLLDYFPADTDSFAIRPEQETYRLRSELVELRVRRATLAASLAARIGVDPDDLSGADAFKRTIRTVIMEGQTVAQFEARDGWSAVPHETQVEIAQLRQTHERLRYCKRRLERPVEPFNPILYRRQTRQISTVLEGVGSEITSAFRIISRDRGIRRIEVIFGASGPLSLDLVVTLENGMRCFPQQLFSEAYRDLLALLFFVTIAKSASDRGQAKVLILDDVLQSVDARIRRSFVDHILSEFRDWQIIATVHDRLWRQQLRDLLDAHRHEYIELHIESWSFSSGLSIGPPDSDIMTRDLMAIVDAGEPRTVGALAGQLLESICEYVTRKLNIPVPRRDGDRYTLGDLWPVTHERLEGTTAARISRRVASHRSLRNLTVHADQTSLDLGSHDARDFASAVLDLYQAVHCARCRSWVRGSRAARCSCGALSL